MRATTKERLLSKANIRSDDGCWEWKAAKSRYGYGIMRADGRAKQAHRVSFELHKGPIPDGLFVCHHCDNPACINPGHLFIGTVVDNTADKVAKGRQSKGEERYCSKLTESDVIAIRSATGLSQRELGERYGVRQDHISRIRAGKYWKHI